MATSGTATGTATGTETGTETGTTGPEPTTGGGAPAVTLPQAIAGAMAADPTIYPTLPVHVAASGAIEAVTVRLDDGPEVAATEGTTWVAQVPVMGMGPGTHTITATGSGSEGEVMASAELVLTEQGVQWTDIDVDGNAGTPTLHRLPGEDRLWLTWSDGSEMPNRAGWLEPIDGAGRSIGERVRLTPAEDDVPYARAAVGAEAIAVLYQLPGGGPYFNRLRVVGYDGSERVAPIELEPVGEFGSYGGDVVYDGSGFVATFRSNNGMGGGDVWWIRVVEATGAVTGPVIVASSGPGEPDGGFDPFSEVSVAAVDVDRSVIGFVRERFNDSLGLAIPKAQVVAVDIDGVVAGPDFVASGSDFEWHWETRVERAGEEVMLLWLTDDLNDPSVPIPTALRAAVVSPEAAVGNDEGAGTVLVQAAETRGEPTFVATGEGGIVAWTDQRSYVDLMTGRIELMATRVDDGLATDTEDLVPHARFVAGTAHLRGAAAGTNAVLVWIDERDGGSVVNPRPEVYLETIWR